MKEIHLGNNIFALVDDEDFENLNQYKWYIGATGYTIRGDFENGNGNYMHSHIMNTPQGSFTDHRDLNKLNNQKSNLRICNRSENGSNRGKQVNNTSGYKGVVWDKFNSKWIAQIMVNQKHIKLGRYVDIEDAIEAYRVASIKYFGEFARQ